MHFCYYTHFFFDVLNRGFADFVSFPQHFLITSNSVGLFGPVDAVHKLCRHKVTQVLHRVRGGVNVVVATFSVVTETVSMLHTQIQTLDTHSEKFKKTHFLTARMSSKQLLYSGSAGASRDVFHSGDVLTYGISGHQH